jgi:hypothetical protein
MNANELATEIMEHYKAELPRGFNVNWMQEAATMLRQQQVEIEALKKEAMAKENSIYALDMMIAQFEDKFGDYEKVINGTYNKVSPHEFIASVTGKEHIVGMPIMYAEWPMRIDE